jgi:hypothetical protein
MLEKVIFHRQNSSSLATTEHPALLQFERPLLTRADHLRAGSEPFAPIQETHPSVAGGSDFGMKQRHGGAGSAKS